MQIGKIQLSMEVREHCFLNNCIAEIQGMWCGHVCQKEAPFQMLLSPNPSCMLLVGAHSYILQPAKGFLRFILSSNNIQMDPEKVAAVRNWLRLEKSKQSQCFLGFALFFITNSFLQLPCHPIALPHFHQGSIYLANRSRRIIQSSNKWCHLLEGTEQTIVVWTDHKNLEYLWTVRRLNPCQTCLALFFTCFNFILSCCSRTKNSKPGALFLQFNVTEEEWVTPDFILPSTIHLGATHLQIVSEVILTHTTHHTPFSRRSGNLLGSVLLVHRLNPKNIVPPASCVFCPLP